MKSRPAHAVSTHADSEFLRRPSAPPHGARALQVRKRRAQQDREARNQVHAFLRGGPAGPA